MEIRPFLKGAMVLALALVSPALHADDAEVLAPIQMLFAGMAHRDPGAIKASALPGATLILMRDGKPHQMTIESFAEPVARPSHTQIEERIHDPLIRVDHDLAVVWAPFEFLADGKPDHCGTDLFSLVHTGDKWLIASIADTGSKECLAK